MGSSKWNQILLVRPDDESDLAVVRRCRTLVVSAWIALAVALMIKSIVMPTKHTTYPVYEAAGRCWRMSVNMYSIEVSGEDFRYSPAFAAAMAPLSALPAAVGGIVWSLLNLTVIGWSLSQFVRYVVPERWTIRQRTFFTLLALAAMGRTLWAGQTNGLISAFAIAGAASVVRGRWWCAAFLLAAPVYIKVWPAACALLFVCHEPRRLAGRFMAALVAIGVAPFLLKPPAIAWDYYTGWITGIIGPFRHRHEYHDLWALWETVAAPVEPLTYKIVGMTAALCVALVTRRHAGLTPRPRHLTLLTLGLWMCWQLIFGPANERNTYSLLGPLTSWAVIDSLSRRRFRLWACASYALITCFSYGGLVGVLAVIIPRTGDLLPIAAMAFAGLLVAASCGRRAQAAVERFIPTGLLQQSVDAWWKPASVSHAPFGELPEGDAAVPEYRHAQSHPETGGNAGVYRVRALVDCPVR